MKKIISLLLVLMTVITAIPSVTAMAAAPEYTVTGYILNVYGMEEAEYVRLAPGVYNNTADLRAAEGLVQIDQKHVLARVSEGTFIYELPESGDYTIWIRYTDKTTSLFSFTVETQEPEVSFYGLKMTIKNLENVNYIVIADGYRNTYRECADNKVLGFPKSRITNIKSFSYMLPAPGEYTVCLRYEDGGDVILHAESTVDVPTLVPDGLTLTVSNIPDIYVVRVAPGEYATSGEIKRADGVRNFGAKTIKSADPYVISFPQDGSGAYSVAVQYNNGYTEIHNVDIEKKVPTVVKAEHSVTFGNLGGLYVIRYAPGEYTTAGEIKRAEGSQYVRPESIDGEFTVDGLNGVYSFLVQYKDGSINVMTYTFEDKTPDQPDEPDPTIELASDFSVSRAFGDHMMVQRDKKLTVWGSAPATENGKYVCAAFKGELTLALVQDGYWNAVFEKTFPASAEPAVIQVIGNGKEVYFTDVLVGDVYYAMGQSNIFWSYQWVLSDLLSHNLYSEVAGVTTDDSSNIRLFRNSFEYYRSLDGYFKQGTALPFTEVIGPDAVWKLPSAGASDFSAMGYLFAWNLSQATDVPIGVIEIDASGMPITTFAPNELAEKWGDEYLNPNDNAYYAKIGDVLTTNPSRAAYNQQIHPLEKFSTAGILWYQGESDFLNTELIYGDTKSTFSYQLVELMEYFRAHFGNSDFPVYIVEYPSCYNTGSGSYLDFGRVRSELGNAHMLLENSYLISSSDLWKDTTFWNNAHPYCKPAQARRAANIALAVNYGIDDVDFMAGPQVRDFEIVDEYTVKIHFDFVGEGLATYGGNPVAGIQVLTSNVAAADTEWYTPASVQITAPDELTVTHPGAIYGVRYHFVTEYSFPDNVNLCNSVGMPAIAFARYWK